MYSQSSWGSTGNKLQEKNFIVEVRMGHVFSVACVCPLPIFQNNRSIFFLKLCKRLYNRMGRKVIGPDFLGKPSFVPLEGGGIKTPQNGQK